MVQGLRTMMQTRRRDGAKPGLDKVLFVDPNLSCRLSMLEIMKGKFDVDCAETLEEAQKALELGNYHAVSTEIFLPLDLSLKSYCLRNGAQLIAMARRQGLYVVELTSNESQRGESGAFKVFRKEVLLNPMHPYHQKGVDAYIRSLHEHTRS